MRRNRLCLKIIVLTLIFVLSTVSTISADSLSYDAGIDAVIIIDISQSMHENDTDMLSISAAKMFIDKLDKQNDRVAVIAFSSDINELTFGLLGSLYTSNIDKLHKELDRLKFTNGFTDSGRAFTRVVEIVQQNNDDSRSPLVVFLADGLNDVDKNSSTRTIEQCNQDAENAITALAEENCPVYTVGLNGSGKMNQEYLSSIAESTDGTHYEATSAVELPYILSSILANHRDEILQPYEDVQIGPDWKSISFSVDDSYIIKTDIAIIRNKAIECELYGPDGYKVLLDDSSLLYYNETDKYIVIQLLEPDKGNWELKIRTKAKVKDIVNISFVHSYKLTPTISLLNSQPGYNHEVYYGDEYNITAQLEVNGKPIDDLDVYNNINQVILYMQTKGEASSPVVQEKMSRDGEMYVYKASADFMKEYKYWCEFNHKNFARESNQILISVVEKPTPTVVPTMTGNEPPTPNKFPWWIIGIVFLVLLLIFIIKKYLDNISDNNFWNKKEICNLQLMLNCELDDESYEVIINNQAERFNYLTFYKLIEKGEDVEVVHDLLCKLNKSAQKQLKKVIVSNGIEYIGISANRSKFGVSSEMPYEDGIGTIHRIYTEKDNGDIINIGGFVGSGIRNIQVRKYRNY